LDALRSTTLVWKMRTPSGDVLVAFPDLNAVVTMAVAALLENLRNPTTPEIRGP